MGTALAAAEIDGGCRDGGLVVAASDRAARAVVARSTSAAARRASPLGPLPPSRLGMLRPLRLGRTRARRPPGAESRAGAVALGRHCGEREQPATCSKVRATGWPPWPCKRTRCSAPMRRATCARRRAGWDQDAGAFSDWLAAFDAAVPRQQLRQRQPHSARSACLLQDEHEPRPPLLLAGFDRLCCPTQQVLFDAWGEWQARCSRRAGQRIRFLPSRSRASIRAGRLRPVVPAANRRRSASPACSSLRRTSPPAAAKSSVPFSASDRTRRCTALRVFAGSSAQPGRPGPQRAIAVALAGCARSRRKKWTGCFPTGFATVSANESAALQAYMRALRRRSLERTQWTLRAFRCARTARLQDAARRMDSAHDPARAACCGVADPPQAPFDWAALVPHLLQAHRARPASTRFRAPNFRPSIAGSRHSTPAARSASMARRITWTDFLSMLARTLTRRCSRPSPPTRPSRSPGRPSRPASPRTQSGSSAQTRMPGPPPAPLILCCPPQSSAKRHAPCLAARTTGSSRRPSPRAFSPPLRIVHFSYAAPEERCRRRGPRASSRSSPARRSLCPLIWRSPAVPPPLTIALSKTSVSIALPTPAPVRRAARASSPRSRNVRSRPSPPRASSAGWEPAEAGLTAAQRGQLLHAVLHAVWAGPPHGFRTLEDSGPSRPRMPSSKAMCKASSANEMPAAVRERMPPRYLELEERRLTRLVTEWLQYESTRLRTSPSPKPRSDRPSPLPGSRSTCVSTASTASTTTPSWSSTTKPATSPRRSWQLPRPDDVQLPLYAGFALDEDEDPRRPRLCQTARRRSYLRRPRGAMPRQLSSPGSKAPTLSSRRRFTAEQLIDWKECIEQLARDFLAGRADVNPRDPPKTCERCDLQTLCRIQENRDSG